MNSFLPGKNEEQAAAAFSKQAAIFDAAYSLNTIIQYKRERVRHHLQQYLKPGSNILELNSGTGDDAVWFAQHGHKVHATDIAAGMQEQLIKKINAAQLQQQVTTELISFTNLQYLEAPKQYDCIFSNFAGLNCTSELDKVLKSFNPLLKSGGIATLVILPKFCLWEFLLLFKGHFKTASRRMFAAQGTKAHIEGEYFTCWYYNPGYIVAVLKNDFKLLSIEGLCTLVPPSYIDGFAEKHPKLYTFLKTKEDKYKTKWPWKYIGDYYIISLQKK